MFWEAPVSVTTGNVHVVLQVLATFKRIEQNQCPGKGKDRQTTVCNDLNQWISTGFASGSRFYHVFNVISDNAPHS